MTGFRRAVAVTAGTVFVLSFVPLVLSAVVHVITPRPDAMLQARELPVTAEEWQAWHALPPDAANAAPLYRDAASLLPHDPSAAYARLVEAAAIEHCRFPMRIAEGVPERDDFRREARDLGRLLEARGRDALARDDAEAFVEAIETLLALIRAMCAQPDFADFMTGSGMHQGAAHDLLSRGLGRGLLDADALAAIHERLDALTPLPHGQRAVLGDMARWLHNDTSAQPRMDAPVIVRWLWDALKVSQRIDAIFVADFLRIHDILSKPYPDQLEHIEAWEYGHDPVVAFFERIVRSPYRLALITAPDHFVLGTAAMRGRTVTALAGLKVEQYRLAHGRLPTSADELDAAGFPLPRDPLGEGAIRYAYGNGGYRTWSVGVDAFDDGGIEERAGRPDMVFQVPRPPEEGSDS